MTGRRWWHVLFAITMLVVVFLSLTSYSPSTANRVGALVTVGVYTLCWATFGRVSFGRFRLALPFGIVIVLASGVLVWCSPSNAIVQGISFPLLWTIFDRTRHAVIANVALAAAVFVGYTASLGFTADVAREAAFIEAISLLGSLALGTWITRIADLSQERKTLLDELTAAQDQLALLSRDSGVTSERERLAREIHDTIAQSLTGVVMVAQRSQRELAAGNLDGLAEQLELLEESGREALAETRSLVAASAPVELGAGIGPALERLAARFSKETGIAVTASVPSGAAIDRDTQVVLLRCAQEALANVRKHSGARGATVTLTMGDPITLAVHDDGSGFDPDAASTGFGLPGMRDRLALVAGRLDITNTGHGTTLTATLPAVVVA
ncbi:MAG: hypothetical protein JWO10_1478 [Microbacteriaceae bacterium]|nr:hypothetical protein [Microbacteriaceae bacterium]